ncbi:DNA ligase ATP-dependent [Lasiodiplodia theobromae]|uniref:DNA ligase ATP-dependent n=1 Tax=Lasiodiplodia theobromae TaxID=45133 RepID=UPI0015C3C8AC|nr:DNA ligase ATP-dependent [Lasiodiplodia theobromae]KAF4540551.1 DNA ligase ATP-dependent [Lasiodiplodia theobromae]KAF9640248.1 DNA ligase ATP-dependent [Lasiodiplodia theobromae]
MAPKQATLGYVKPKQMTLGKFFGKPSGDGPPPQQTKLSFSTKANAASTKSKTEEKKKDDTVKKENDVEEHKDSRGAPVKDEDVEMEDEVKPEEDAAATDSDSAHSKKRAREESEEEDDEPVPNKRNAKKARQSRKSSSSSDAPSKPQKKITKTKVKREEADEEANEQPPSPKKTKAKSKKEGSKVNNEDVETKSTKRAASPPKATTKGVEADASSAESEKEDEEVVSSEDETPAAASKAAKAREKVQSTLKSIDEELYPDWKAGEPVPYAALCAAFSKIEMTTKRLEISAYCAKFFRQVLRLTPEDLLPTVLLMVNKLAADYAGIELGIGESLIMKSIGETTGRSLAVIKADQKEIGDLGLVAAKSRSNQPTMFKPKPLTVRGVHKGLMDIATIEGQGSQGRKVAGIKKLLSASDAHLTGKGKGVDIYKDKGGASEAKFIVRMLEGKLRLGLADKSVLVSLAHAMVAYELDPSGKKIPNTEQLTKGERTLKSVYSELPSYEVIIPAMLEHGLSSLREHCKLQPGVPLKPMLAKPTKSITEVLDRFEGKHFTCEYKYDGERAQIHFVSHDAAQEYATEAPSAGKTDKGVSNIFSRNSEDLSKKYPDILEKLPSWVKEGTKSFVLDCETVAWDVDEKKVLPFQTLMTRKRKDVKVEDVKVKVCVFAFDLLYLNGEALVNKPFRERRDLLHASFAPVEGEFTFAQFGDTNELDEIQDLLDKSVKASCEGLMVKMLDGPESSYEPSKRSQNWLKVKKDYLSGVGDSLDLVVLGAYYGKGKRTSVYGAFLLACYNSSNDTYETVCNIGTGFSDEVLANLHAQLSPIVIDRPKPFYSHSQGNKDQPDVWFEPKFVWEVKTADLTLSPRYMAAMDVLGVGKGVSLRFPRFIHQRDDKKADQATSARQVAEMYRKQEAVTKNKGPSVDDDFEY